MSTALLNPEIIKAALDDKRKTQKMLLYIGIGIVVVVLFILFFRKIIGWFKKGSEAISFAAVEQSIVKKNLSYSEAQYAAMADQIFKAVDGAGTDEEAIYSVMKKMNNEDDLSKLIVTYGVRTISDIAFNPVGLIGGIIGTGAAALTNTKDLSLSQALQNDLDENELKQVNIILAGKGIKYRF